MTLYRGSTLITDIYRGNTPIASVYRGSTLVWSRASSTLLDDFNRADAATLGSAWTDLGSSGDFKLGVENNVCRIKIPEGLIGGFFDLRTSNARYNVGTLSSGNGYIETRPSTRGDGYSATSLSGFSTTVYARVNNTGATLSTGIGIGMQAGSCFIATIIGTTWTRRVEGGTFQAGDRLRMSFTGNVFTLSVNGVPRCVWTDSSNVMANTSAQRSLGIGSMGGKDLLGPRRFGPALDYVSMS